ncbi:hypothetical protein ID80_004860 [Salmonella enterica subsp. enterica serovar Ball]|nr:hypothetical protein [Salmonella enterica subsp. enterica serovar Minnesota]EDV5024172.1 hypothetical protein [Salmonella enterica subsp. enterica serovar Ball]
MGDFCSGVRQAAPLKLIYFIIPAFLLCSQIAQAACTVPGSFIFSSKCKPAPAPVVNTSTSYGDEAKAGGTDSTAIGYSAMSKGNNSVALGANSVSDRENDVNIGGLNNQGRTLSGLSDGVNPDDAVNKKQLDTVNAEAQGYADKAKTDAVTEANKYTDKAALLANNNILKKANSYVDDVTKQTLKSANDNTERRAVVAENNAVTRSKAHTDESSSRTLESARIYTNHRAVQAENNAVSRSNAYTDNRYSELRKSLDHTAKRLNAGIAGVTALSSIPYVDGNRFSYGIGAGNYRDGNAVAAGVQLRVLPSANVRLNISWDSAGNNATGVGIAGGW